MAGLLLLVLLTAGVFALAIRLRLHVDPENAPTGNPGWAGPDAAALSAALAEEVAGVRTPPPRFSPSLDELAASHAFDMAMRGYDTDTNPEGEGLDGRRLRLFPKILGESVQWQALTDQRAGEHDAQGLLGSLVRAAGGDPLRAALAGPEINEVGVGAAVERGRVALCVVMLSRWGTLDDTSPPPDHDGWTFTGELAPALEAAELRGRWRAGSGEWSAPVGAEEEDLGHLGPDQARRFRLTLPVPTGTLDVDVQFLREEVHGPLRKLG